MIALGAAPEPPRPPLRTDPDWAQADLRWIRGALARASARPSGGWLAVDATRALGARPRRYRVDGRDLVAWRDRERGRIRMGPDLCPHMGASLAEGHVERGCVVCPWHGLALRSEPDRGWRPLPVFDDGVLFWVQMPAEPRAGADAGEGDDPPTARPALPERPPRAIAAVMRMEARCEPQDVIANRLDPWHGVHFHPHSFGRLCVVDQQEDEITVRVVYRIAWRIGIEVDARFHCPDPRTIAMTIVAGEGTGSVVETHATPVGPGRTAILEATLATSSRPGFALASYTSRLVRPWIERAARRLWTEDAAYAERRYALRRGEIR